MLDFKQVVGLDGIRRDLNKLWNAVAYQQRSPVVREAYSRFKATPTPHNYTNCCVESCKDENAKDASYLGGHVIAVSLGLNIVLAAAVAALIII